jgi:predicted site-specific integrase-resolvase
MNHTRLSYPVKDAAHLIGVSTALCYRLLRAGTLRYSLHPGTTLMTISAREIDRYLAEVHGEEEIARGA